MCQQILHSDRSFSHIDRKMVFIAMGGVILTGRKRTGVPSIVISKAMLATSQNKFQSKCEWIFSETARII